MVSRIDGVGVTAQGRLQLDQNGPNMEVIVKELSKMVSEAVKKGENEFKLPADQAKQMTANMNTFLEGSNTELRFEFHDKLNEYYVTIVNPKTREVIKEIPSKKLMDAHAAMREFNGLFVNHKI